jgi:hypothetical protein
MGTVRRSGPGFRLHRALRRTSLVLLCLTLGACARTIEVGSGDQARQYRLTVENLTGITMVVSYNDGRGDALLGNVAAGRTEYFVISRPSSETVTVRGQAASGTRSSGPYTITLTSGAPTTVQLR